MTSFPTPSDYQEAVQVPESAFRDAELQTATPRTNVLGLPQPITGAFAAVFPMTTDAGRAYAVKCFLTDVPKQQLRYDAVSAHLEHVDLNALVPFDYQPEGIRVSGTAYPIVKMEWVDGTVLNRFVEQHLSDPERLGVLARSWADLMVNLEDEELAHGDLQHGNVLVQSSDDGIDLRLVDYDTMYVPTLAGRSSPEVGHRNYQHPDRTDSDFGPFLDRFPELAIYTALQACAAQPSLWERYNTGENLLFRDSDFYDPDQSVLFEELATIEPVVPLVEALHTACYVELVDVPPLSDVRAGRIDSAAVSVARRARRRSSARTDRSDFARWFLPSAVGGLGLILLVGVLGGQSVALGASVCAVLAGAVAVTRRYRRLSLVRRRRRLEQEEARITDVIQGLQREVQSLKERRERLRQSMDERRAERLEAVQQEALYDRLKHHFIGEVREVEGIVHKHVVRLKSANIRTAYEATPEAIASVRRISDEARARIAMWRAALVRQYEDEIPDSLSPAQERRLRRLIDHRIQDVDEQVTRTKEKIQVQETERQRVRARLDDMPSFSLVDYVLHLVRLRSLPELSDGPRDPSSRSEPTRTSIPEAVPQPLEDDRAWWKGGG